MLSPKGSMGFLTRVRAYLQDEFEKSMCSVLSDKVKPRLPLSLIAAYCTGAQIGLIWWWVENRLPIPAETMARYASQISLFGLNWALGGDLLSPEDFPLPTDRSPGDG
jgi:hypothetical protein